MGEAVPTPTQTGEEASSESGAVESEAPAPAAEPAPMPAWPSFPSYGSSFGQPASTWEQPAPQSAEEEDLAAAVDQMAGGPVSDVTAEVLEAESAPKEAPSGMAEEFEAPPWVEPEVAAAPAETGVSLPSTAPDGALERAQSLVDELKSLLTALAVPSPAAPAIDVSQLVSDLSRARDEATSSQGQLDALMSVVESARERPRDIDVMLDLSRQVEAIAALKAGYDRCLGAIDETLARLKSV
jgi:hypothetical protein